MAVDPRLYSSTGTQQGVSEAIADLKRKINKLNQSIIGDNAIDREAIAADAIFAEHITANAITAAAIDAGAIQAVHIQAGAIETSKLDAEAVTAEKIKADDITAGQIAADAITTSELAAGAVTATEIAAGTITSDRLYSGTVEADRIQANNIAADVITSTHIATDTLTATEIAANAITTSELDAGAVTATEIAAGTITSDRLYSGTVEADLIQANNIGSDTITANEIAADAITVDELASNSVTTIELAADAVEAGNIAADAIQSQHIAADQILSSHVATDTLTADNIAADTITGDEIAGATITGGEIAGGTVQASHITISSLSALSADLGTITAGTVTGATLQTADSGSRWVLSDTAGAKAYDDLDNIIFNFDPATGDLSIKGDLETGSTVPAGTVTGQLTDSQLQDIDAAKLLGQVIDDQIESLGVAKVGLVDWIVAGGCEVIDQTTIEKTSGTDDWNAEARSTVGYTDGCYLSAQPGSATDRFMIALNSDPATNASYSSLDYAWYPNWNGILYLYESGWLRDNFGAYDANTVLAITYDGENVRYYKDGALERTVVAVGVGPLFFDSSFYAIGSRATNIRFGPLGGIGNSFNGFEPFPHIEETQITDNAITSPKITANAITATKINAGAITTDKLDALAVTGEKIAGTTITGDKLVADTITASQIDAGAITSSEIATGAVLAGKIEAGAVTATKIATDAVETDKLNALAVTGEKIAGTTITGDKIAGTTITGDNMVANTLTADEIATGAITADELAANSVIAGKINAGAVTAVKIDTGAVIADKIDSAAVTSDKIEATAIDGKTITGATVQTAATGSRVAMDTTSLRAVNSGGATVLEYDITAETLSMTGTIELGSSVPTSTLSGQITNTQITDDAITAPKLAANAVEADKIKAGAIDGKTITGAVVRTHAADSPTVLDDFNRANENPVSQGGNWVGPALSADDDMQVVSNQLATTTNNSYNTAIYDKTVTDGTVTARVPTNAGIPVLYIRTSDEGGTGLDGYRVLVNYFGTMFIQRIDNGSVTGLDSASVSMANGHYIGLEANGSTLTAWHKAGGFAGWTKIVEVNDFNYSSGRIGAGGDNTSMRLDEFSFLDGSAEVTRMIMDTSGLRGEEHHLGQLQATPFDWDTSTGDLTIEGGTITGSTVRTSASGARTQMDDTAGIRQFDTDGTTVLTHIPSDGSAALFSGDIHANELITGVGDGAPSAASSLRGETATNQYVAGTVGFWHASGDEDGLHVVRVHGNPDGDSTIGSRIQLVAADADGGFQSLKSSRVTLNGQAGAFFVNAQAGAGSVTIVDDSQQSDFLQLTSTADRKINFGIDSMTGDGSSSQSVSVSHGLGRTPQSVVVTSNGSSMLNTWAGSYTSSTFDVILRHIESSGWSTTENFSWIAIG